MAAARTLRIGTRASRLATWQASWVADQLRAGGQPARIEYIRTSGDATQAPIVGGGMTGVFTRELQIAVLDERVDLAVHSLKDLPTATPEGLCLAAVPSRASPFDALISRAGHGFEALPSASRLGTGSPRRQSQLTFLRPDLVVEPMRGNVDTRLRKLDDGDFDAIVLAEAGLDRLGLGHRITQRFSPEICMPAPAQGALGIETRSDDVFARQAAGMLNHAASELTVSVERTFLAAIEAGCSAPIGAWCRLTDATRLELQIVVLDPSATRRLASSFHGTPAEAPELGRRAAAWALEQGAADWR